MKEFFEGLFCFLLAFFSIAVVIILIAWAIYGFPFFWQPEYQEMLLEKLLNASD